MSSQTSPLYGSISFNDQGITNARGRDRGRDRGFCCDLDCGCRHRRHRIVVDITILY